MSDDVVGKGSGGGCFLEGISGDKAISTTDRSFSTSSCSCGRFPVGRITKRRLTGCICAEAASMREVASAAQVEEMRPGK